MYMYACMHVCIYLYIYVSNIYVLAQESRVGGLYVQTLRIQRVKCWIQFYTIKLPSMLDSNLYLAPKRIRLQLAPCEVAFEWISNTSGSPVTSFQNRAVETHFKNLGFLGFF